MKRFVTAVAALLLAVPCLMAQEGSNPTAERTAVISTSGARAVRIVALAGSLRIEGRRGLTEARAHGTASTAYPHDLGDVRLVVERHDDTVYVKTVFSDSNQSGHQSLDLVVEVPAEVPLDVRDGSGDTDIRGVGDISIHDGSGDLRVSAVDGLVRIWDGSGEIRASRVRGDVEVLQDGSGAIDVDDIGGDFLVDRKGSGAIHFADVRGRLRLPDQSRSRQRERKAPASSTERGASPPRAAFLHPG